MNKSIISVLLGAAALGVLSSKLKGSKSKNFRPINPNYLYVEDDRGEWNGFNARNMQGKKAEDIEYVTASSTGKNGWETYIKILNDVKNTFPNLKGIELGAFIPEPWKYAALFPDIEEFSVNFTDEFILHWDKTGVYIPDEIIKHPSITRLSLITCEFPEFPKELTQMTNLRHLNLSDNENLFTSNNPINKNFRRLSKLVNLESLNLVKTGLKIIPEEITNLPNLKQLILNYNQIEYIPRSIVKMENLVDLRVSYNPIASFPDYLCELTNLRRLEIKGTKIKEIPNHFGNLKKLVYFNQNRLLECPSPMQVAIWISQGMSQSIISDIIRYCKKPSKRSSELRRF